MKAEKVSVVLVGDGYEDCNPFRQVMVIGMERKRDLDRLYVSIPYDEAIAFARQVDRTRRDMEGREGSGGGGAGGSPWPWGGGPKGSADDN